jgi:hypothetical protein
MVLISYVNVKLPLSSNSYVPDCCLFMTIVVALFPGSRRDQFVGKMRELSTSLVFKNFWVAFWSGIKALKFSSHLVLSRAEIQRRCQLPDIITPKPSIGWRKVNACWKSEKVVYIFGIQLLVKIQTEKYQIYILWLLLAVKAELTSMPNFPFGGVAVAWERNYSL